MRDGWPLRTNGACALLGALLAWTCSIDPVDLEGKDCPCAAEYTCDPRTNTCIIGNATGGAAGASTGGAAGGGGAGGLAGSSGSGGTAIDASADAKPPDGSAGDSGGSDAKADGAGGGGPDASGTDGGKGSCVGHCSLANQPVPGSVPPCYCDALCEGFKDCCADRIAVCGKAPTDAGADGAG